MGCSESGDGKAGKATGTLQRQDRTIGRAATTLMAIVECPPGSKSWRFCTGLGGVPFHVVS
ncbi:hypothetical protein [Streptomyces sp. SID3343]|uniref:hypothetical protein n=1 Tax=Streptomyces sp. SID3343 TaxID=2690260 RepID=UPI00136CDC87|nr:hypothetical protein [Streptomyces sp. SID3343]MYV99332.1 hypothetical protein [Streptomyces sp. SID3343]